jgi:tetratricopeptide (TPR) repeat protein
VAAINRFSSEKKEGRVRDMKVRLRHNAATSDRTGVSRFDTSLAHGILIIILCVIAYSNTFSAPFQLDDASNIVDNPQVRNIHLFLKAPASTRGVGYFTFALNYWLHGADVAGYHIVNLVIHILTSLLLYGLIVLSFRTPVLQRSLLRRRAGTIALFSALLFAAHPVQTEAVTYIVQRLASLAALFYIASLAAYVKSRLSGLENRPAGYAAAWYAASLLSAVLAMKTKEIAFTLPVVITLFEFLFFEGPIKKRIVLLFPLLLTMLIIPMTLLGTGKPLGVMLRDVSQVTRVETAVTRTEYLLTEFAVIVTYLRLFFLPINQNLDYSYPLYQSFFEPRVVLSFLLLSVILGTAAYFLSRDRRFPGAGRLIAFGVFWFFITLSVESSVIPIVDLIFEHRLYLPSAGFFITCVSALFLGAERLKTRWPTAERAVLGVLAAAVIVFAGLTYTRNIVWGSEVRLWQDVIQKSPEKARGYNGLGLAYNKMALYDKALMNFDKGLSLEPENAGAYNGRGVTYDELGRFDKAIEDFNRAIALDPSDQRAFTNRGLLYGKSGRFDKAIEDFETAIALDPSRPEAYNNLGIAYAKFGLADKALEQFNKTILLDPEQAMAYYNRGLLYSRTGDSERARADYQKACGLGIENACRALQ